MTKNSIPNITHSLTALTKLSNINHSCKLLQIDYLNSKYANLLPGNLVDVDRKSVNQWILQESKWFKVAYSLAESKLKEVYAFRKQDKFNKNAELLRIENQEKFNLQSMDKRLWEILDKYVPGLPSNTQFFSTMSP